MNTSRWDHTALSACSPCPSQSCLQRGRKGFGLSVTSNCLSQGFLFTPGVQMMRLPELSQQKKSHMVTCEMKGCSTTFILSSQAASPFILLHALLHLTHAPSQLQCPACRHGEHRRNSSYVCCLSSHPSCTDRSSKVLVSQYRSSR